MSKRDLHLARPVLNAAGSLGFTPDPRGPVDTAQLGAFITNPVSAGPRRPPAGPRWRPFPGGALLHSGHMNAGLSAVLRRYGRKWARSPLPVIVHLLARGPEELAAMAARLEEVEGVMAVEIGLPHDVSPQAVSELASAAGGEIPAILRLPLARAEDLASAALDGGAAALSLGPPRGAWPDPDGGLVQGRIYGPAVFPLALRVAAALAPLEVPVIAGGGVYSRQDVDAMLAAGAAAVQVDTAFWRGDWQ